MTLVTLLYFLFASLQALPALAKVPVTPVNTGNVLFNRYSKFPKVPAANVSGEDFYPLVLVALSYVRVMHFARSSTSASVLWNLKLIAWDSHILDGLSPAMY